MAGRVVKGFGESQLAPGRVTAAPPSLAERLLALMREGQEAERPEVVAPVVTDPIGVMLSAHVGAIDAAAPLPVRVSAAEVAARDAAIAADARVRLAAALTPPPAPVAAVEPEADEFEELSAGFDWERHFEDAGKSLDELLAEDRLLEEGGF